MKGYRHTGYVRDLRKVIRFVRDAGEPVSRREAARGSELSYSRVKHLLRDPAFERTEEGYVLAKPAEPVPGLMSEVINCS